MYIIAYSVIQPSENTQPNNKSHSVTTYLDTTAPITLDATYTDGDSLTYSLRSSPSHGTLSSFDKDTGSVVYSPKSGYTETDSFTFTASDESSTSNTAKVSITVNPVTHINTTPVAKSQSNTTILNTSSLITITSTDTNETN